MGRDKTNSESKTRNNEDVECRSGFKEQAVVRI